MSHPSSGHLELLHNVPPIAWCVLRGDESGRDAANHDTTVRLLNNVPPSYHPRTEALEAIMQGEQDALHC